MKSQFDNKWLWLCVFAISLKSLLLLNFCVQFKTVIYSGIPILTIVAFYILYILTCLPFIIFILSFVYLFKGSKYNWYIFICNTVISLILFVDALYFRAFDMPISAFVYYQQSCLEQLGSGIISLIHAADLFYFIDLPIFGYVAICRPTYNNLKSRGYFLITFTISAITILILMTNFDFHAERSQAVISLSPLGYHFYDVIDLCKNQTMVLSIDEQRAVADWEEDHNKINGFENNQWKGIFEGHNLIVIQFESLEDFALNATIDGQEILPNTNKLLNNSLYFTNIYEQVADGNSADAEFIFHTSLYPLRKGSVFFRYPSNTYYSFPLLLAKYGYANAAIHGDDINFWNRSIAYPNLGYTTFIDEKSFTGDETIGMGLSDRLAFENSINTIQNLPQPYLVYLITLTSHMPFNMPTEYQTLSFDSSFANTSMAQYLQSIHYTDQMLGYFMDELKSKDLLKNTVICIYGDHEGIHKYYYDESTQQWPNNKNIPLIMYHENLASSCIEKIGGQIDIYPTLSFLMGVSGDDSLRHVMGVNLLNGSGKGGVLLNNGDYLGDMAYRDHCLKGMYLSELIIKSNYYSRQMMSPLAEK